MSLRYPGGFITASYNGLKVPNAPTIGTATAGLSQISIAFTAPSDVGGGAITSYTATATKTSDGTTVTATGSSSPIVITGVTSTAYTVTVFATNSYGSSALSAASNSVTPLVIGVAYGGGYFAGQISTTQNGVANYNLVVGPKATAQSGKAFRNFPYGSDPTSQIDGPTNSSTMNNSQHPAAQYCEGLTVGGYTDWYMPALLELEILFYNLKPVTGGNYTTFGINPYAVPPRASNYSSSVPGQTSAAAFQSGGAEAFESSYPDGYYWASTQKTNNDSYIIWFENGYQGPTDKQTGWNVRAIRRVAV